MSFSDVAMFTLPACPLAYSHCIMHPGLTRSKPETKVRVWNPFLQAVWLLHGLR